MASIDLTSNRFRALRMTSVAQDLADLLSQAEGADLSHLSFAELIAEHEQQQRTAKRIAVNRRKAQFPTDKRLEEFDYQHQTTIRKREVNALLDFDFIEQRHNIIFIGPPLLVSIAIFFFDFAVFTSQCFFCRVFGNVKVRPCMV